MKKVKRGMVDTKAVKPRLPLMAVVSIANLSMGVSFDQESESHNHV